MLGFSEKLAFRLTFACLGALGLLAANTPIAHAQGCSTPDSTCTFSLCKTPASGANGLLWGELEAVDGGVLPADRDTTDFDQVGDFEVNPYWISLDVENGWVATVAGRRLQLWNAVANPAAPFSTSDEGFRQLGLTWTADAHAFYIFEDVDMPPGNSNLVAVVGRYGIGLAVFDIRDKEEPEVIYQDHGNGRWGTHVYATTIGGRHYAFVGADQQGGVFAYDLTTADGLASRCTEAQPSGSSPCPGVYLGKIGSRNLVRSVDGAGNFIAVSSGVSPKGFDIWNVSNPASPTLVMNGLSADSVYALAMWQQGSSYYLAARTFSQARIYNVSCITSGSCALGAALWTGSMPNTTSSLVTFSRSGSIPFLYFGDAADCQIGNQNEWLYDVSSPAAPRDITPPGTVTIGGRTVSYWGWYYRRNGVFGYNRVAPRMGKFQGDYFYRAAHSIFDIHRRVGPSAPVAGFSWNPTEVYPGTSVNFTDQSSGLPTSWSWQFQPDGDPATSTVQNPGSVEFASAGTKTVQLQASNLVGADVQQQNLTVLPPEPVVAGVTASPNPALLCQPITFSATGVTGQPPLSYGWIVRDAQGGVVTTGGNLNPFVWTSVPTTPTTTTYRAEVTVTNNADTDSAQSPVVVLNALPALPAEGSFLPTYDGQPNPPSSGTVQFHVAAAGATEWNWRFGDDPDGGPQGDGYLGWSSNPSSGPNPLHTYSAPGVYSVQVKVRNCTEPERESGVTSVDVEDTTPLQAEFQASIFCQIGVCFADPGQSINFVDSTVGSPDFWDYDWNGDGVFEDINHPTPVSTHSYGTAGLYFPRLRVRRGQAQNVYLSHPTINVGSATADPSITVSGPGSGLTNQPLTFSAVTDDCPATLNAWVWTTGGGGGVSTDNSITITWTTPGSKTVTATNPGCLGEQGLLNVLINTGNILFADGFESGDTSAWSETVLP